MTVAENAAHFRQELKLLAATFPNRRSSVLPALRLAKERYGELTPEVLEEVGGALGYSRAYCSAQLTFLEPVGRHEIKVCTGSYCARAGADELLTRFERACDVSVGKTSADGEYTLRRMSCLGHCDSPVVVADGRVRGRVRPRDVKKIVRALA
jgi:NADH-quinone oxidoreductase subunit E